MNFAKVPNAVAPETQKAWERYLATMDEVRAMWLNSRWAGSDSERAQAMFHALALEHVGFNGLVASRQMFPYFTLTMFHHPISYTWGACCPDFPYRFAFVDGSRSYRIWGKCGSQRWTEFHVTAEFWGDRRYRTLGTWDFDNFKCADDGSFEIIASPTPHEGNWIKLDREERNTFILLRDAVLDWGQDELTEIHIEALDLSGEEFAYVSENNLSERLDKVCNFVRFSTNHWIEKNDQIAAEVGFNDFVASSEKAAGGIVHATYLHMLFDVGPGEALVIETDVPQSAKYWSVQLADLCYQTLDYMHHQSSLNEFQAKIDPDGKARFVLSLDDPGVPNWIDPVGMRRGVCAWRWVKTNISPTPAVAKVPLADVRKHLHPETPKIAPKQRQSALIARRDAMRKYYGM